MANANTALVVPYYPPQQTQFQWSMNAAMQLVLERRAAHDQFAHRANRDHNALWTAISNNIFAAVGFVATANQCKMKWNALKREYENLQRIMHDNPEGFPISSPNSFDEACFQEMSDEFWARASNYLFQFFFYLSNLFTLFIIF